MVLPIALRTRRGTWKYHQMSFNLSRPRLSDAPQIADLHVATWREAYAHLLPVDFFTPNRVQNRHEMWPHILASPRDEWSVNIAEDDGMIIGFAMVGPSFGSDGQVYSVYVSAEHHGTGVGQALLDAPLGEGPAMRWGGPSRIRVQSRSTGATGSNSTAPSKATQVDRGSQTRAWSDSQPHPRLKPPSLASTCPTTHAPASVASQPIRLAGSAGRPNRPNGVDFLHASSSANS